MAPLRILAHWRVFSPLAVTYHSTSRQDRYVFSTKSTPLRRSSKNRKSLLPESTQSLKKWNQKQQKLPHKILFFAQKKGELWLVAERQQLRKAQMPVGTQAQLWVSKEALGAKNTFKSVLFSRQLWYKHQLLINLYSNFDKYPKKFAYWTNKWVRILFTFFRNILEIFKSVNIHSLLNAHLSIFAFLLKHP